MTTTKGHSKESRYSPRRIEAVRKQKLALDLRMAGHHWDVIAREAGYASHSGAIAAVEAALQRTLRPSADSLRALTAERLTKILQVFWPRMIHSDEDAAKICFRALADLRALLGLDAPIKVQVDIREEARRIAQEMGLDPEAVVKEAEELIKAAAK